MASPPVKGVLRQVKPILSSDSQEAKRRVLKLYKIWCKELPGFVLFFNLPITYEKAKEKLRNDFLKHKDVTDIRVIDMLVVKGQMEFQELLLKHKQRCHVMYLFRNTQLPAPKDFLSKFINGTD